MGLWGDDLVKSVQPSFHANFYPDIPEGIILERFTIATEKYQHHRTEWEKYMRCMPTSRDKFFKAFNLSQKFGQTLKLW